jgi:hypothetical protein
VDRYLRGNSVDADAIYLRLAATVGGDGAGGGGKVSSQAPAERRGKGVNRNGRMSFFLGPSSSLWPRSGFALCPFTEHKRIARLFLDRALLGDLRTGDRDALDCEQAHLDEDHA